METLKFYIGVGAVLAFMFGLPWMMAIGCVAVGGSHAVCGL